jgi:hypothetical protein
MSLRFDAFRAKEEDDDDNGNNLKKEVNKWGLKALFLWENRYQQLRALYN